MGLGPREIVIAWIAKPLICFKTFCIKNTQFLMSTHNFVIECNGEARRRSAKNGAGVLAMDSFPVCGIKIGEEHSIQRRHPWFRRR